MRVCVVGCGAVGSLFAANLALLDDVEVWAYDLSEAHVTAINERGLRLVGAGDVHATGIHATTDAAELPPCDFGLVATKAMHTDAAIAATAHAFATGSVASVQNGVGNEETLAGHVEPGHPRDDVPGGQDPRARRRAVGRQGRHDARPVRAEPRRAGRDRAPRGGLHEGGHADGGRRGRARRAVAEGDLQREPRIRSAR